MSQKLRKGQVAERYQHTTRTIERWTADKTRGFPQPIYIGRAPLWDLEKLEEWEKSCPSTSPIRRADKVLSDGVAA
jgi:predicted DNA-binding transcriptional regulator AlpA